MTPLVSVLVPYRNVEAYITEALTSVLADHDVPLELIAVDDGSTDASPALVSHLARTDPRIRAVHQPARGIVAALTHGLALSRAPFIARMDADDVTLPGRWAAQLEAFRATPSLSVVATRVEGFPREIIADGLARYIDWLNSLLTPAEHARDIFVEAPVCHPSVMMRRDALRAVGDYRDVPWPEDYDLWLRFHTAGHAIAKLPQTLLRWRHRAGRLTFSDPRFAIERIRDAKARYLAVRLRHERRAVVVWGAGPFGKRLARALEREGVVIQRFVDIDPKKIGRTARNAPIVAPETLDPAKHFVLAAVGVVGVRDLIRSDLASRGFAEPADFVCTC